ncbi:MAG: class I SAM-dependent methyltransferase [Phenylobacterium sp.]|nr:class I SAM-dependent methyltransferase [Phenylobacterium sp.]
MRRAALFRPTSLETLAHLAIQSFLNEFAWRVEPEEAERVAGLVGRSEPENVLRLACYQALAEDAPGPTPVRAVVRTQVLDVEAERRFAESVPALTPIAEGTSQTVRAMYEANPYPRWASLSRPVPNPASLDILVAGCGTGRHALHTALRHPNARVLAVDLSRASLGYAIRKGREAGISNVTFAQADLLHLPALGRTFDVVESVGTLPCMADPGEGLAALVSLTRPGGRLRLGLYSEEARKPLRAAQALGDDYPPTPEGIRAFRKRILDAPPGDPLRGPVDFADFYATSSCRDLLLHVQEHRHTIPQLAEMLGAAGLKFCGFDLPSQVLARMAEAGDPADLMAWEAFEARNPATFRGMYQLWATRP